MEDTKQKTVSDQNQANPSKFYLHFLYKAAIVTVFLVILPLFPSQAPDFINQTLLTRSWELLHLVFVGIAVSYGLFSRRNEESEKENHPSKFDNAQSYVSKFLQVSSVFDDETQTPSGSDETGKVQTWSSQYFRNEPPMVVMSQEHSVIDEQRGTSSRTREKPLLLPVRSLKTRFPDSDSGETGSGSGPNLGSKRGSRNRELKGLDQQEMEEKLKGNLVLPSPIPWRSRSGRLEMKEEVKRERQSSPSPRPSLYNQGPSMEESELNQIESRPVRPQTTRSSRPNSAASSPTAISAESQAKSFEDFVRKKSFHISAPPPPPPPPPPALPKSQSFKSSTTNRTQIDEERDLRRSYSYSSPSRRAMNVNYGSEVKSVRTTRAGESAARARENGQDEANKRAVEAEANLVKKSVQFDQSCFVPKQSQYIDKVIVESDEDSEDEDGEEVSSGSGGDEGPPDVDKKADEFIAKFREQIRLQRIESIKKSSGHANRNSQR